MKKESCLSLCVAFAVFVVSCSPISNETSRSKAYSKKATWQEAMLASRVKLPALIAEQKRVLEAVELGTWYIAGPIKGGKFTDRSFAEKPVDLSMAFVSDNNCAIALPDFSSKYCLCSRNMRTCCIAYNISGFLYFLTLFRRHAMGPDNYCCIRYRIVSTY